LDSHHRRTSAQADFETRPSGHINVATSFDKRRKLMDAGAAHCTKPAQPDQNNDVPMARELPA